MSKPSRQLVFGTLGEIEAEIARLQGGHRCAGSWTLAQICTHLAEATEYSLTEFPSHAPWFIRYTVGSYFLRRILATSRFPTGIKMPERYNPAPAAELGTAFPRLQAAHAAFMHHTGRLARHPLGPRPVKADWLKLHCLHAAHHLGFVVPEDAR